MLTPEYLQRITEGAEEISSSLHRTIMDMIIKRIMKRLGRGEDYLLTQTDRWQIQVLQESGELLEDIQKEIAGKTKLQQKEIKDAFIDAGITSLKWDDAVYIAAGLTPTALMQSPTMLRILERDYLATAWNHYPKHHVLRNRSDYCSFFFLVTWEYRHCKHLTVSFLS